MRALRFRLIVPVALACVVIGAADPARAQTGLDRPTVIPPSGNPVAKPSGRPGIDRSVPEAVAPNPALNPAPNRAPLTAPTGGGITAPGASLAQPGAPNAR